MSRSSRGTRSSTSTAGRGGRPMRPIIRRSAIDVRRRQPGRRRRQLQCEQHAVAHRLAVAQRRVAARRLQRVPEGVAEVEQLPLAVPRPDHARRRRPSPPPRGDDRPEGGRIRRQHPVEVALEPLEQRQVEQERHLDHLEQAGAQLPRRQGGEPAHLADDDAGMVEESRPSSSPRAGRSRSCRRSRRRPAPAASSAAAPPRCRAGSSRRRSPRGRRRCRRRRRRPGCRACRRRRASAARVPRRPRSSSPPRRRAPRARWRGRRPRAEAPGRRRGARARAAS